MAHRNPGDVTERFSNRVESYIRYRPGYPEGFLGVLRKETHLSPSSIIVDVGSGTGISTGLFLQNGNTVYAVEPNEEMRRAAESQLGHYRNFSSIAGRAEATTLPDAAVDMVTALQAFHWFDRALFGAECRRILKPDGWVVLAWNRRRTNTTPFLEEYERLLSAYGTDYQQVNHARIGDDELRQFFAAGTYAKKELFNMQALDYEGLEGRVLSSSYMPTKGDTRYQSMATELRRLFDRHNGNGYVSIEYDTEIHLGRMR